MQRLLLVFFLFFLSINVEAKEPARTKAAERVMTAKTESALVFAAPDMDSEVISYLAAGQRVRASTRVYRSASGTDHRFYKISLGAGRVGYVATIDLQGAESRTQNTSRRAQAKRAKPPAQKRKTTAQLQTERAQRFLQQPMAFNPWFGVVGGLMRFKEKVEGATRADDLPVYGLKITGPDTLIQGPITDLNIFVHAGAPDYYQPLSRVKPTGFAAMTDALLILPFGMSENLALYLGAGPYVRYSSFRYVAQAGGVRNQSTFSLGASVMGGAGYRIGAVALRLEAKSIFERSQQSILQLSLQTLY